MKNSSGNPTQVQQPRAPLSLPLRFCITRCYKRQLLGVTACGSATGTFSVRARLGQDSDNPNIRPANWCIHCGAKAFYYNTTVHESGALPSWEPDTPVCQQIFNNSTHIFGLTDLCFTLPRGC